MDRVRVCIRGVRLAASADDTALTRELSDQIRSLFEDAGAVAERIMGAEPRQ